MNPQAQCQAFLDRAVLGSGVNLVDTAEEGFKLLAFMQGRRVH